MEKDTADTRKWTQMKERVRVEHLRVSASICGPNLKFGIPVAPVQHLLMNTSDLRHDQKFRMNYFERRSENKGTAIVISFRKIFGILLATLLIGLLAACTTTPVATPTPETGQVETAQNAWERIQQTGTMQVGTSADYPPFESYDQNFRLTGFDIALMQEIGRVMGVDVEFTDIAFDGLGAALQLGQIDAAIAAISVTPEREAYVDFSQVYYVSEDGILAAADSEIGEITSLDALADYRVGVQEASVYANRLQDSLVETGAMPAGNLFVYGQTDQAVRDLVDGRIDLVLLDLLPAQAFADSADVRLVGQGFARERYAIAVPEGVAELQTAINQALAQLQDEDIIASLTQEYLDLEPEEVLPTPSPTPVPTALATPAPTATPPAGCLDGLEYVADLTYDDQNMTSPPVLQPGEAFRKGWRVRNSGTCTWGSSYTLTFVEGNSPLASMGSSPVSVSGNVAPGATYDLYVDLVAPLQPGTYRGVWQMRNGQGVPFGERVWTGIVVPGAPTPTPPAATATPSPNINFNVDRTNIRADECVTFRWDVQNVREVYFYADGQNWQDHGVAGQATRQECPDRTTTYNLRVVKGDGATETRQITIGVEAPATEAPRIDNFMVNPSPILQAGQCVNIVWQVTGELNNVRITRNGADIWNGAPYSGSMQDCPPGAGTFAYGIEASGPGGTNRSLVNVNAQ
jgi:polar amino acid transport system substrate-binding protein